MIKEAISEPVGICHKDDLEGNYILDTPPFLWYTIGRT